MTDGSVTIKDIAKLLGISKSTVSRALAGHFDVNPDTRQRIIDTAQKLHYQPNVLALNLKKQRTNTIGVIIPETAKQFFAKAIGGIQRVARTSGYNVMICESDESYINERNNVLSLLTAHVDGLLISVSAETENTDHFAVLLERRIPVVFFDRICEQLDTSQVFTDNYEISFEGTEHLLSQGCMRIAAIAGPQNLYTSRNRLKGYIDALRKHDIPIDEDLIVHSRFRGADIEKYARHLLSLSERPDAVFAINDLAAIEMIHLFRREGIRVPEDIAILGFNNENICNFIQPSLSSIEHPAFDIGVAAAEVLLQQLKTGNLEPQKRVIKSKLVIRESSRQHTTQLA